MNVRPGCELVTLTPHEMVEAADRAARIEKRLSGSLTTLRHTRVSTFHGHFLGAVGEAAFAKSTGLAMPDEPGTFTTPVGLVDVCTTEHHSWMYGRAPDLLQPADEVLEADIYLLAEAHLTAMEVVLHGGASREQVQAAPTKKPQWQGASPYYQVTAGRPWLELRSAFTLSPV